MAILDRAIVRTLPAVPKPIVRKISGRYIAGTHVEDACRVVARLNGEGKMATIDVLGEEITTWEEARHIGYEYENVFRAIDEQGLDSNVSIKLTALGLKLDLGLCREILQRLVRQAAERRNFVRTWRTRAAPTTRCASTAGCATPGSTTWASCSRPIYGGRWTTSRRSRT